MLTQVGKYQIVEKIGVGGFGTVYKGRDPFIKRNVAIKTCQSAEEEIRKRFFREAEFAGNLHHRNITTIYDFGVTDDGTPYIVQEFLTGDDLDKIIKRKDQISLKRKIRILLDVCEGLGYAHGSGIIHRDIKPSNIRILDDDTVKIMDFGIAKSMVSESTLTQTGITLGTASYLAPEQIRGETLDPRTDIFSLGVLGYELLTGQKPFTGDHISTVLYKIMNETPPRPSEADPSIPRAVENVIIKALEKDRAKRPASCAEMKAELGAASQQLAETVPTKITPTTANMEMDRTVATPSSGFNLSKEALRADARASDRNVPSSPTMEQRMSAPGEPPAPRRLTPAGMVTGSVAEVHLRKAEPSSGVVTTPAEEGGHALRIFLASLVVLGVVGGGAYLYLKPSLSPKQVPTAAPTPAPAPAATAEAAPATSAVAAAESATTAPAPVSVSTAPAPTPTAPPPVPTIKASNEPVQITFESNANALLTVDGKKYTGLPAPRRISLKPGKHSYVFEIPNYERKGDTLEVKPGQPIGVRSDFAPRGMLQVNIGPPEARGAEIRVDGVLIGKFDGASVKKPLRTGSHEVEVRRDGFQPQTKSVDIAEDDLFPVRFDLKKAP
jgi:serine/threonine protein kinase